MADNKLDINSEVSITNDVEIDTSTDIGKLIHGLSLEVQATKKNVSKMVLKDGIFSNQVGDLYVYEFPLIDELLFQEDANLTIHIGKKTGIRGYIHKLEPNLISIASEENVGQILNQITITNSDSALLERLRNILQELVKTPESIPFSHKYASFAIGRGTPSTKPLKAIPDDVKLCTQGWSLNTKQDKAVRIGMGSDFLLLWGPPGTGKTVTMAPLLAALANTGESILLVSNTNKAVDGALEKTIQSLERLGLNEAGTCLRIGQATPNFVEKFGFKSDIKTVAEERNQELIQERENLVKKRWPLGEDLNTKRAILQEHKAYEACLKDLRETDGALVKLESENSISDNIVNELVETLFRLESDKKNAPEILGFLEKVRAVKTKGEIETEISILAEKLNNERISLEGKKNSLDILQEKLSELKKSEKKLKSSVEKLPSKEIVESQVEKLEEKLSSISAMLVEIDNQISSTEEILIANAKVVGTTVYKSYLDPRLLKKTWDVVVVDEVSMLLLPMTYFVAGKAKKRVILVGDFLQLPSIVSSDQDQRVMEWVKADPFKKWDLVDHKNWGESSRDFFVGLKEQNRMHDQINSLISQSFYNGKLITGTRVKDRVFSGPSIGITKKRILLVDTSGLNSWSSRRYGKGSLFNISHAAIIGKIIEILTEKKYFQTCKAEGKTNSLGIVTPYAAQQELISTLLKPVKHHIPSDSIGTAHKFQGDERDTIIVDMVESLTKPSRFINAEVYNDDAGRLLNVGLSRAKEFLIVIVNKDIFDSYGSRFMKQLWNRIESMSERIDPKKLLTNSKYFETAREIAIGKNVAVEGRHVLFTEQDFYKAMTFDLASASKSIEIFSAFLTINGTTRWLAVLNKAMSQGARIRIVTKTLDKQPKVKGKRGVARDDAITDLVNIVKLMRRSGIVVDLRSETHEKVIVIDGEVVWNGSLNMLSQVQDATREHMTRIFDKSYATEISKLLSRHDIRASKTYGSEHPVCPSCGSNSVLTVGNKGVLKLECEDRCGWKVYQKFFKKLSQGIPLGIIVKPCPEPKCCGSLILRNSYGKYYLGCSEYGKGCRYREDVHINKYSYNPFPENQKVNQEELSAFEWPKWEEKNKTEPVEEKNEVVIAVSSKPKPTTKKTGLSKKTRSQKNKSSYGGNKSKGETRTQTPQNKNKKVQGARKSKSHDLDSVNGLADKYLR